MPYIGNITQDFNVSNAMLDTDSVTSIKIVDGTIEGADIAANLDLSDSQKIRFGAGNDLQIYHDGSDSYISEGGTGLLKILSSGVGIKNAADSQFMAFFGSTGASELYFNGSKKFETTNTGATVTGALATTSLSATGGITGTGGNFILGDSSGTSDDRIKLGAGGDLHVYHDGTDTYVSNATGDLRLFSVGGSADDVTIRAQDDIQLQPDNGDNGVNIIGNGAVELYYDNSLKLDTRSGGVGIGGDLFFVDSSRIYMGSANDFILFHDGANTQIVNSTGNLVYRSDTHHFKDKDNSDTHAKFVHDGAVELYYDNSKKFETASTGITITGGFTTSGGSAFNSTISFNDDASFYGANYHVFFDRSESAFEFQDNAKATFGTGNDLQIYHNGTRSEIINNTGDLIIQTSANNELMLRAQTGESHFIGYHNAQVELYYDGSKKFATTSTGVKVEDGQVHIDSASSTTNDLDMLVLDGGATGFNGSNDADTQYGIQFKGCSFATGGIGIQQRVGAQIIFRKDGSWNASAGGGGQCKTTIAFTNSTGTFDSSPSTLAQKDMLLIKDDQIDVLDRLDVIHNGSTNYVAEFKNTNTSTPYGLFANSPSSASPGYPIISVNQQGVSPSTKFRVDSHNGRIYINTDSMAAVSGGSAEGKFIDSNDGARLFSSRASTNAREHLIFYNPNGDVGDITTSSSSTTFNTSSDYRLKENEVLISDGITRLKTLKPYKFNWKTDTSTIVDGFFAHEVTTAVPEAVTGVKDGTESCSNVVLDKDGKFLEKDVTEDQWNAGKAQEPAIYPSDSTWEASYTKNVYQKIDHSKLVPLLTAALQEEISKREALEARVAALEAA